MGTRLKLLCDCHGREILGEIIDGNLLIFDRRHGENHQVVVDLLELVARYRKQGGWTARASHSEPQAARQPSSNERARPCPMR